LSGENTILAIMDAGFVLEDYDSEPFTPKGVEAGLCKSGDICQEEHIFVYARKPT